MPEHWPDKRGFQTTWQCAPDPGPQRVGNITDGPDGEYITDRLTDEALKFIEAHRDEPFLLNRWQYGVHGPENVPAGEVPVDIESLHYFAPRRPQPIRVWDFRNAGQIKGNP